MWNEMKAIVNGYNKLGKPHSYQDGKDGIRLNKIGRGQFDQLLEVRRSDGIWKRSAKK